MIQLHHLVLQNKTLFRFLFHFSFYFIRIKIQRDTQICFPTLFTKHMDFINKYFLVLSYLPLTLFHYFAYDTRTHTDSLLNIYK